MHTISQLERLSERLEQLPFASDAMTIRELDGFIAGVVLCPDFIAPDEWISAVWGEEGPPAFSDPSEAAAIQALITAYYDRVVSNLDRGTYEAVFEEDPDTGAVLWEAWIDGFDGAMHLREESWKRLLERAGPEGVDAAERLIDLYLISIGESALPPNAISDLSSAAPDLIPQLAIALHRASRQMLAPAGRRRAAGAA